MVRLEPAVQEAASNIMKHASHGRTDEWINREVEAFADRVAVRLHHLGDSFDPSGARPPSFDGSCECGFRIYRLSKSVDDVRYYRDNLVATVSLLVKRR